MIGEVIVPNDAKIHVASVPPLAQFGRETSNPTI